MNQRKMIVILLLVVAVVAILFYRVFIKFSEDVNIGSTIKYYFINFDEINQKTFFRAKVWGIAGNHEEMILSSSLIGNVQMMVRCL